MNNSASKMDTTFMYFAYGSNLLRERILVRNSSAIFKSIGLVDNCRLAFDLNRPGSPWKGAGATIEECPGQQVWGCVWTLRQEDIAKLDEQEGVSRGIYNPISISVQTPAGEQLACRSYQLAIRGSADARPSPQYKSVIQRGAKQNGLPIEYQQQLAAIEDNGYEGKLEIMVKIEELIEKYKGKQELSGTEP
ncbi:hypothetical protein LSH36_776g02433 [Paralvinella palmiformis]|uniref:gamma-glutamylcyclotransferase n=1 Tax=Paralvinella palmiformis TaxID=53620 RepID=A0AAD9J0Y3_9ANNE|nr:hypothetical protein LSH36_776g02433 [Paralvinella palmiformis]